MNSKNKNKKKDNKWKVLCMYNFKKRLLKSDRFNHSQRFKMMPQLTLIWTGYTEPRFPVQLRPCIQISVSKIDCICSFPSCVSGTSIDIYFLYNLILHILTPQWQPLLGDIHLKYTWKLMMQTQKGIWFKFDHVRHRSWSRYEII